MLKNTCLLLLTSLPSLAFAEDSECCVALLPPEPIESCQVPVGYFYPAQYSFGECGWDISISGEFIYWEIDRDSVTSVGSLVTLENNGTFRDQKTLVHHQGYRPGFKVAAGIGLPGCDDWKLDVEYTWFHHRSTNHYNASAAQFITLPILTAIFDIPALLAYRASSAKSEIEFNLDFISGVVGRAFYLSQRLIVDAGVGLKAWWSKLDSDLTYTALVGGAISTQRSESGLWGIGPYVSAQIKGLLWCGTYLYGKVGVWNSYMRFNKHKILNNYQLARPFAPFVNEETNPSSYYFVNLFYEGALGLGWGTYLCDCDYHIDFLVGYDMMTTYTRAFIVTSGDTHKEFYYQGLFVKAQFDF
jgi:hypothetical protein